MSVLSAPWQLTPQELQKIAAKFLKGHAVDKPAGKSSDTGHAQDAPDKKTTGPDWQLDPALWEEIQRVVPKEVPQGQLPVQVGTIDGGIKVMMVDGDKVMVEHDMDFTQAGNSAEAPEFIPNGEIWLDMNVAAHEWPFNCYHEAHERRLMANQGMEYAHAHERANHVEKQLRIQALNQQGFSVAGGSQNVEKPAGKGGVQQQPAESGNPDDTRNLADNYAQMFSDFVAAGMPPSEHEIAEVDAELEGSEWKLQQGEDGLWTVVPMVEAVAVVQQFSRDNKLRERIDKAASETDASPSEDQKKAGNYRKGRLGIHGFTFVIESPKGSTRSGKNKDGKPWSVTMQDHYGYILKTESEADGDHIDVFLGPHPESEIVFVIDQNTPGGRFDEHKCMLGFLSEDTAKEAYHDNYSKGWKGFRSITPMTMDDFRNWIENGDTSKPLADQPRREVYQYARTSLVLQFAAIRAPYGNKANPFHAMDKDGKPKDYFKGQFIPGGAVEKLKEAAGKGDTASQAAVAQLEGAAAGHEATRQKNMQARQQRDLSKLKGRLSTHAESQPLDAGMEKSAAYSFRALKRYHGDLLTHRLDELSEQVEARLAKVDKDLARTAEGTATHSKLVQTRQKLSGMMAKFNRVHQLAEAGGQTQQTQPQQQPQSQVQQQATEPSSSTPPWEIHEEETDPESPDTEGSRLNVLGAEGRVKFKDPLDGISDQKLSELAINGKPLPLPPGGNGTGQQFKDSWNTVSILAPQMASLVKSVRLLTKEELSKWRFAPAMAINPSTGELVIGNAASVTPEILWHELVHAEQFQRGDFQKGQHKDENGLITPHGRLMESEAHQRGNIQGKKIIQRFQQIKEKLGAAKPEQPHMQESPAPTPAPASKPQSVAGEKEPADRTETVSGSEKPQENVAAIAPGAALTPKAPAETTLAASPTDKGKLTAETPQQTQQKPEGAKPPTPSYEPTEKQPAGESTAKTASQEETPASKEAEEKPLEIQKPEGKEESENPILSHFSSKKPRSFGEIAKRAGLDKSQAAQQIKQLLKEGKIQTVSDANGDRYVLNSEKPTTAATAKEPPPAKPAAPPTKPMPPSKNPPPPKQAPSQPAPQPRKLATNPAEVRKEVQDYQMSPERLQDLEAFAARREKTGDAAGAQMYRQKAQQLRAWLVEHNRMPEKEEYNPGVHEREKPSSEGTSRLADVIAGKKHAPEPERPILLQTLSPEARKVVEDEQQVEQGKSRGRGRPGKNKILKAAQQLSQMKAQLASKNPALDRKPEASEEEPNPEPVTMRQRLQELAAQVEQAIANRDVARLKKLRFQRNAMMMVLQFIRTGD